MEPRRSERIEARRPKTPTDLNNIIAKWQTVLIPATRDHMFKNTNYNTIDFNIVTALQLVDRILLSSHLLSRKEKETFRRMRDCIEFASTQAKGTVHNERYNMMALLTPILKGILTSDRAKFTGPLKKRT